MNQKELIDKINQAANHIHKQSLKNTGNYVIVSPRFAEMWKLEEKRILRVKKLRRILNEQDFDK